MSKGDEGMYVQGCVETNKVRILVLDSYSKPRPGVWCEREWVCGRDGGSERVWKGDDEQQEQEGVDHDGLGG